MGKMTSRMTVAVVAASALTLVGCTSGTSTSPSSSAASASAGSSVTDAEGGPTKLGVLNASGGTFDGDRLVLTGVDPVATWFDDRPERVAGIVPLATFVEGFWVGQAPPNVAVELVGDDQRTDVYVLELSRPEYDPAEGTLAFDGSTIAQESRADGWGALQHLADRAGDELPPSFGRAVVFVDSTSTLNGLASPSASPTASPTGSPTASPTASPTTSRTGSPTESPTGTPTGTPTVGGPRCFLSVDVADPPSAAPTPSGSVNPQYLQLLQEVVGYYGPLDDCYHWWSPNPITVLMGCPNLVPDFNTWHVEIQKSRQAAQDELSAVQGGQSITLQQLETYLRTYLNLRTQYENTLRPAAINCWNGGPN